MKKTFFILCFFTISFNLYSQSAYTLDLKKDIVISSLALGAAIGSYLIDDEPSIPNNLNKDDVNAFDRWLMYSYNATIHNRRDIIRNFIPVLPIITPLAGGIRKDFDTWLTYGIMYGQALTLTYGTNTLIRKNISRYRPRAYFEGEIDYPIMDDGFPSDTTAFASFLPATFRFFAKLNG